VPFTGFATLAHANKVAPADTDAHAKSFSQAVPFYGINGHVNQGAAYSMPFERQRDLLLDLGIRYYRNDLWDDEGARNVARLCDVLAPSGISVLPCLTPSLPERGTERDAYRGGYELGRVAAKNLKGRVAVYECGNELENGIVTFDGSHSDQYDAVKWPLYRGVIRGMIDGVRSTDANAKVGIHASWLHFGALMMLWHGTEPRGGNRVAPLRWDVTMYHWYSDMGDIRNAKGVDVLDTVRQAFKLPVWITEFGWRPDGTDAGQANYITNNGFSRFLAMRGRYDLQSAFLYELFDMQADNYYGLLTGDGRIKKPAYYALKRFIASNPAHPASRTA
jgi:hypothetical protein